MATADHGFNIHNGGQDVEEEKGLLDRKRVSLDGSSSHEIGGDGEDDEAMSEGDNILTTFEVRKSFLYRCIMTAALGSLLLGFDIGIISGALIPIKREFNLTHTQLEMMTSSILFTSIIGSVIAGAVADYLGRKNGLIIASVVFCGGSIGMATADNYGELLAWRCVTGVAVGMGLVICPIFSAELSPRRMRGALTSFNELFINVGIPLAYFVGLMLRGQPNDWRWMLASGVVPAVSLFIMTVFLPESPSWLLKHGHEEEARLVVSKLVDPSESPDRRDVAVKLTMDEMKEDMKAQTEMATWSELFLNKENRPALLVGMTFASAQQLIGLDSLIFYSVYILAYYGIPESTALLVTLVMGLLKLATTVLATQLVDTKGYGRRWPLLIGASGCVVGMLVMALATSMTVSSLSSGLFITGIYLYLAAFGLGYGPMCWLILAEIFQGPFRSKGLSMGSLANRLSSFLIVSTFLSMIHGIGLSGTFFVYTAICVLALLFTYIFIPELRGKKIGSEAQDKLKRSCRHCL